MRSIDYVDAWAFLHSNYQFSEYRTLDAYRIWCDEQFQNGMLEDYVGGRLLHGPADVGDGRWKIAYGERRGGPYTIFIVEPVGRGMRISDIIANAQTYENF